VLPDNVPTLARVAPEPRGNGASASIRRKGPRDSSGKCAITRAHRTKCGCGLRIARPSNDTLRSKAKPTRTIRPMKPTSRNAREIIWRKRFGVPEHFAFSGIYSAGSASCVIRTSPGSRAGVSIIASPAGRVVPRAQITVFCFIPSATTGFTPKAFSFPNRVSLKEAFEGLEPDDGKLSRPVLRGLAPSNGGGLLGERPRGRSVTPAILGFQTGPVAVNVTSQAVAQRSPCQRTCAAHKSRDRLPPMKKAGGLVLLDFVAVDSTSGPAPVRSERQGAKLCAIETILRRIRKSTKPAV
jgi:hypothetical protein